MNIHFNVEFLVRILEPFADISDAGKRQRKSESDESFIKSLRCRPQTESSPIIDAQLKIDGQVLVSSEIIDDAPAALAINHVGVEAAWMWSFEVSDPRHGLASERVEIGIVSYPERDRRSVLGKHNAAPSFRDREMAE